MSLTTAPRSHCTLAHRRGPSVSAGQRSQLSSNPVSVAKMTRWMSRSSILTVRRRDTSETMSSSTLVRSTRALYPKMRYSLWQDTLAPGAGTFRPRRRSKSPSTDSWLLSPSRSICSRAAKPADQLILGFSKKRLWRQGVRVIAPDLDEMSGCGVWSIFHSSGSLLDGPRLAGLFTEWHRDGVPWIVATRIDVALAAKIGRAHV